MTDLRDKIAAVLYARAMSRLAWHRTWDDLQPEVQQMWLEDADAVIRELELEVSVTSKSNDGRFKSFAVEGYWEEVENDD